MIPPQKQNERFREFIRDKKLLIADVSPRVLEYLSALLQSMGLPQNHLYLADSFEGANQLIKESQPEILLCDYDLDKKCGLALIETQRRHLPPDRPNLCVLVTGNTSQLAVARASEGEVDAYILKPFTGGILRDAILKAAFTKIDPNPYEKEIAKGKLLLESGKIEEAETTLEQARSLNSTPALAYYYLGKVACAESNFKKAQEKYLLGLKCNRIHQKCMTGLYEVLMEQKLYADAYAVIKRVSYYFPANPRRITAMLKLAILTHSYDDVERCYRLYSGLDDLADRNDEELLKYICAALVVCGKHYLQKNIKSRSLDLFHHAAKTAANNTRILKEVILALLDSNLDKEAEEFMRFFPESTQKSADYLTVAFALADRTSSAPLQIAKGMDLINQGHHDPLIYQILIRRMIETSEFPKAQDLVTAAISKWPDMESHFHKAITARS